MGNLDKVLSVGILVLVICVVIILLLPDKEGNNGYQLLSPLIDQASRAFGQSLNQIKADLTIWTNRVLGEMRGNPSNTTGSNDQSNPIDNAISPVQNYGEEQKELFNNTMP
jgi:hypothetical protein